MSDKKPIDETNIPQAGDWVFFYPLADRGAKPIPAMVLQDSDQQRAADLELHYVGNIGYAFASKHMDGKATEFDRERNGGWAWNRTVSPIPKPTQATPATATAKPELATAKK